MKIFVNFLIAFVFVIILASGCSNSDTDDTAPQATVTEDTGNKNDAGIVPVDIPCAKGSVAGAVFIDVDGDGVYRTNDKPVPGVQVTDGKTISLTDAKGIYSLPAGSEFLYITKPAGYGTGRDRNNIPAFFQRTRADRQIYSFTLKESVPKVSYSGIIINDIHLEVVVGEGGHDPDQEPLETFNEYLKEFTALNPKPDFVIAVGDQSGVTPESTKGLDNYVNACRSLDVPFYNAMGNPGHNDSDLDRVFFKAAYRNYFGPLYYSFDYGNTHFIILDTNLISGDHGQTLAYGVDENQMSWLTADLELNKDKRILLFQHEPADNTENTIEYIVKKIIGKNPDIWIGKEDYLALLAEYKVAATFVGHTHSNGLYEENGTVFVTNGAVSGAWWGPNFNGLMSVLYPAAAGLGINANPDGTPQGYRIMTADAITMSTSYKAFRQERGVFFADPDSVKIGTGKLSYFDIDTKNSYTFCMKGLPGSIVTGQYALKTKKGIIPLVLNAFSLYPIQKVEYKVGTADWLEALHSGGLLWQSHIDASAMSPGFYTVKARITDEKGSSESGMTIYIGN